MKHFEDEYRKYVHENTPDLWDRIEAGLSEKTDENRQTAAQKTPDTWQVIENKLKNKPAGDQASDHYVRKTPHYLRNILTTAAGICIIIVGAAALNLRQKSVSAPAVNYSETTESAPEYDMTGDEAEASKDTYTDNYEAQDFAAEETASRPAESVIEYDEAAALPAENASEYDEAAALPVENAMESEEAASFPEEDVFESEEPAALVGEDMIGSEKMTAASTVDIVPIEELNIKLALPHTLTARSLTAEEEDRGYICAFEGTSADGSTPDSLTVRYISTEAETLGEYQKILEKDINVSDLKPVQYGGREYLEYKYKDSLCLLYYPENGTPAELSVTPVTPGTEDLLHTIIASPGD